MFRITNVQSRVRFCVACRLRDTVLLGAMEKSNESGSGKNEELVTQSQKLWRRVIENVSNEDYEKAIQLCNTSEYP